MSKKRGKSSSAAGQGRWEAGLMAAGFEEENWRVNIQFIVENDLLDENHIKALANVVKIPQRRLFSHLHKDDLMEMVNELGNPKNKRPPKLPQFFEITEIVFGLLNAEQEIPLPLWAKLIKFGLLNIKDNDLRRRETEAKSKEEKEKAAKGSGKKRPRSKSPGKGKGKKTPEPSMPKKDWSNLKKRGEDDDDNKYIDDEPDDGPEHYIFVSGFRKPQLLPILTELGINVNGVIKLSSESYEDLAKMADEKSANTELDDDALAVAASKKESDTRELALFWKLLPVVLQRLPPTSKLQDLARLEFVVQNVMYPSDWEDAEKMIGYGTTLFEDLACKVYDSLDWKRQYLNYLKNINLIHVPVFGEPEPSAEPSQPEPRNIPSAGAKRDKTKAALEPPTLGEEIVPPITPPTSADVDSRYYRDLMDTIPMDSVSVPLIMHCILEQIVATEDGKTPPSKKEPEPRTDGIHLALADCISEALDSLCLSDEDAQILSNDFPMLKQKADKETEKNKVPEGPVILHYRDETAVRTHHLDEFNGFCAKKAEEELYRRVPSANLLSRYKSPDHVTQERAARLHELLRHATSAESSNDVISSNDIDRAFRQFVFESMELSHVDEDGSILYTPNTTCTGNPWDDPYTLVTEKLKQKLQGHNANDQEKGSSEAPEKLISEDDNILAFKRSLDAYCYTEHLKPNILLQILEEARSAYPCMDSYTHKRDNSLFLSFHHPTSKDLNAKSTWSTSLHSDVGFRNYLEHVACCISDWTHKEEQEYQAHLLTLEMEKTEQTAQSTPELTTPPATAKRPRSKSPKKGSRRGSASRASSKAGTSEDQQFSTPFIRAGSLKAETELQNKLREEEERIRKEKESKQSNRTKSAERIKQTKSAASKTSQEGKGKRPKSGRRSKSRSRSRSNSGEREVAPTPQVESKEEPKLPFIGYDVGNKLINIKGRTSYLSPSDGGTIKSEVMEYEHGKVFVKTSLYKDGHTFILHVTDPRDTAAEEDLNQLVSEPSKISSEKSETETQEKDSESGKDTDRPTSAELLQGVKEVEEDDGYSLFSSWCATLCDGMTLSLSKHGPDGVSTAAEKAKDKLLKLLGEIPPASSPSPVPPGMETPQKKGKKSPRSKSPRGKSPKGKRKGDQDKEAEAQRLEELKAQEELERKLLEAQEAEEAARKKEKLPKFQQLYVSCPDGLSVRYQIDPTSCDTTDDEVPQFKLMVRQSYPYKTAGRQETERARSKPAMEEVSRTILHDGTVIKLMSDGSTKILYGDGTVCDNLGSGPILNEQKAMVSPHSLPSAISQQPAPLPEDQRTATSAGSKKGSRGRKSSGKTNPEAATDPSLAGTTAGQGAAHLEAEAGAKSEAELEKAASWKTSYLSGEVTVTKPDGVVQQLPPLMCYTATDPVTGEVMMSREDKVVLVTRVDGTYVCDHTDGTRITRYYKDVDHNNSEEQGDLGESRIWFIRVECNGYASVIFNQYDQSSVTVFGSGSSLVTNVDGTYHLSHWNGGQLDMEREGSVLYTPRPDNDFFLAAVSAAESGEGYEGSEGEENQQLQPRPSISYGSYIMRQNSPICCEAIDQEGNIFQVKVNGEASVINPGIHGNQGGGEHGDKMEDSMKMMKIDPQEHHPPRLFVIHEDGSGTELLRQKDVQEYIGDAVLDPTSAVIRENLPDDEKVTGITVMRPHYGNCSYAWLVSMEEENIIPKNIKTRDLTKFPSKELKKPGPPFGTTTGKGLAVGSAPVPLQPPPAPPCPTALEIRQLVQYQPITKELRSILKKRMVEFGRMRLEQEMQREALKINEPRSSEEQMRASDLLTLVLDLDEDISPRAPSEAPQPSGAPMKTPLCVEHSHATAAIPDQQNSSVVKETYEKVVAPPPPPVVPPPREKLTQADWDLLRRGIEEEKANRIALRHHDVPAYFDSDIGRAWLLTQANDMKTASMQLSLDPRRDGTEARMVGVGRSNDGEASRQTSTSSPPQETSEKSQDSTPTVRGTGTGIVSDTPSKMRPTNPTPAHASGKGTPTKVRPDNPTPFAAAQPRNMRPSNPTPSHASPGMPTNKQLDGINQQQQPSPIPENPTSAQRREDRMSPNENEASNEGSHPHNLLLEREDSDLVLTRSLLYDATGQPRKGPITLPNSILSDKPGSLPNTKFMTVEEPVRRKVKTSSISGGLVKGHQKVAERGFQLLPPEVVFGILREGNTYSYTVQMRNTGIDLCRFKVKQPPPGTGMRVHYTPGPVAAGMSTKLLIEVYAIAVGVEGESGVGTINHQLEIITETDILFLPITAIVLTANDYDNRREPLPQGGKAPGVKLSSSKPPSRDGILRPMKMEA